MSGSGLKWHSMAVAPLPPDADRRCKCAECGNTFSTESGFDNHRVGEHGTPDRRCVYPGFRGLQIRPVPGGREWYTPIKAGTEWIKKEVWH